MEPTSPTQLPRAYSVRDFCKAFGVSRSLTYSLLSSNKLRSVRVAGRRLIPADAAEALLNGERT
jgi:excisionase family DNA binding protein